MKDISLVRCLVMCAEFAFLCGRENFEGSADDPWAQLYDHFIIELHCMSPTEDALMQHVLRAFRQIVISMSAHLFQQTIPEPT